MQSVLISERCTNSLGTKRLGTLRLITLQLSTEWKLQIVFQAGITSVLVVQVEQRDALEVHT